MPTPSLRARHTTKRGFIGVGCSRPISTDTMSSWVPGSSRYQVTRFEPTQAAQLWRPVPVGRPDPMRPMLAVMPSA